LQRRLAQLSEPDPFVIGGRPAAIEYAIARDFQLEMQHLLPFLTLDAAHQLSFQHHARDHGGDFG